MKSTCIQTVLVTMLVSAMITICPMTSHAADYETSPAEAISDSGNSEPQCSLVRSAAQTGCGAPGKNQDVKFSVATLQTQTYYQPAFATRDDSGAMLEDLLQIH